MKGPVSQETMEMLKVQEVQKTRKTPHPRKQEDRERSTLGSARTQAIRAG
ncbi:hypothetical protein [Paenibacillus lautus]|nr:hypothetical protein [Paenibacillus lautus]MEC0254322.1 hypothetical protein [Paenibacillus lautus]